MSILITSSNNKSQVKPIATNSLAGNLSENSLSGNIPSRPDFQKVYLTDPSSASKKTKMGVFATTVAGVAVAMAFILKGKKLPFGKGLLHATYEEKEIPWMVTKLAVGTVAGGLVGGALFDKKEHMKSKYRESIIQLVGNIFTPLLCVWGGSKMFKKIEAPIVKKLVSSAKSDALKAIAKEGPAVLASTASLIAGIFLGNKVGNTINKKTFKCDEQRKLKLADMSPHIDDLCLSITLIASQSKIGFLKNIAPKLTRLIPVALLVAGYSTGVMQESPARLAKMAEKAACTEPKKEQEAPKV